ncbi:MAG: Stk1 family PASTA domain-containing Ser/Thr kinase [Nocardioidaceae bacterium]
MSDPTIIGNGRYELSTLLGRGGMAEVRRAKDLRLGRTVAIKRLRADLASDPTFQARFRREAQSAASLNHPTVVAVYDTGEEQAPDDPSLSLPYIVMECVEGRTLRDILREGRKILPERALEIIASVLSALDYSHRAGIIHRDIKPANVMLTPSGDVKVMDFGIARAVSDSSATMTQTAAVVGTAQYLSPEQARGEQVDARSDLYSAGCLLYELLTGRPPFVGDSPVSVAYQHVREEAPPPSTFDPEITSAMDAITMKALAKPVDERYQSAAEMRADVERALEGRRVLAPAVVGAGAGDETEHFLPPPPMEEPTAVNRALTTTGEQEPVGGRRRNTWWIVALVLLVAAIIAALILVPRLLADEPTPTSEVPDLQELTVGQAERALEAENLELGSQDSGFSRTVPEGQIMGQSVPAGEEVDEGTEIDVVVSAGAREETVPDVTDLRFDAAKAQLEDLGFNVVPEVDDTSEERRNEVISTDPNAGVRLPVGSKVTVVYSAGYISVPSVTGVSEERATRILEDAGFRVNVSDAVSDQPEGTVVSQDPAADTRLPFDSYVTIEVSLGPPETTPTTPTTPTETTPPETTPTTPTETATTRTTPTTPTITP